MKSKKHLSFIIILLLFVCDVKAHPGGVKRNGPLKGCHNDRKKGNFHCHKSSSYPGMVWSNETEALKSISKGSSSTPNVSSYDRDEWRYGIDLDGDCQTTRAEILISRTLKPIQYKNVKKCVVLTGEWEDFYFPEKLTIASEIQIDHLVSLNEAHNSGGAEWSQNKKEAFANDPENLVITSSRTNGQKGSNDIHNWIPSIPKYACRYLKQWIYIKQKYGLSISESEKGAVEARKCSANVDGELK